MSRAISLRVKRGFDILASGAILAGGWPALAMLAALVKATSPGKALFVQERIGLGGRPFRIYKFRTMQDKPPRRDGDPNAWTAAEEDAVTPVGRVLRDYGLDELPQLLNILRGDMSVIGPRPLLAAHIERFDKRQRKMLEMRPGVLSLAAIRGRRSLSMAERIEAQVEYVETWSLRLDLEILLKSLLVVASRADATDAVADGPK